jgi:hypothetical protein
LLALLLHAAHLRLRADDVALYPKLLCTQPTHDTCLPTKQIVAAKHLPNALQTHTRALHTKSVHLPCLTKTGKTGLLPRNSLSNTLQTQLSARKDIAETLLSTCQTLKPKTCTKLLSLLGLLESLLKTLSLDALFLPR